MIFTPESPALVTSLATVDGCRLYKIQADGRVFYLATNPLNPRSCFISAQ